MATYPNPSSSTQKSNKLNRESIWQALYPVLRRYVSNWVYSSRISSWSGQQHDIIEDIIQEAITRTVERSQRAESGEASPIDSLEHISVVIAYHYYTDLWRRDRRIVRLQQYDNSHEMYDNRCDLIEMSEIALDNISLEILYVNLAVEISKFPEKQRTALLTDLANRMHFDTYLTPLQRAFQKEGIQLQDYQQPLSQDSVERSRHAACLSLAYQRIRKLSCKLLLTVAA